MLLKRSTCIKTSDWHPISH